MPTKAEIEKKIEELRPIVEMSRYIWVEKNGVYYVYNSRTWKRVIDIKESSDLRLIRKIVLLANENIDTERYLEAIRVTKALRQDLVELEQPMERKPRGKVLTNRTS